jgi:hypothetical protein
MKIPTFILGAFLTALIALNGWVLLEVVNLKVAVAALTVRIDQNKIAKN